METISESPVSMEKSRDKKQNRLARHLRRYWKQWLLIGLTTISFSLSVFILPFMIERRSDGWLYETNRQGDDLYRPLNLYERYYQFNTDSSAYQGAGVAFPRMNETVIFRPVYPAVAAIVPTIAQIVDMWPDVAQAIETPKPLRFVFLSMLVLNLIMMYAIILMFFSWAQRYFSAEASLLSSILLALSPIWAEIAVQTGTKVFGFFAIMSIIYMFDTNLLAEEKPRWWTIIWVGLLCGVLMLGKSHYDALFVVWLWALMQRRWRVFGGTLATFYVPAFLWRLYIINFTEFRWYNADVEGFKLGQWIPQMLTSGEWYLIYPRLSGFSADFIGSLAGAFGLLLGLAFIASFFVPAISNSTKWRMGAAIVGIGIFSIIVGHNGNGGRFASDAIYFVYPMAVAAILYGIDYALDLLRSSTGMQPSSIRNVLMYSILILIIGIGFAYHTPFELAFSPTESYLWNPSLNEFAGLFERLSNLLVHTGPGY